MVLPIQARLGINVKNVKNVLMYWIKYKRIRVKVLGDKSTQCECCLKTPKPRGMHTHHWKYEFTIKEVARNPELAKKNSTSLCYKCHRVANAMRIVEEEFKRVHVLEKLREKIYESNRINNQKK